MGQTYDASRWGAVHITGLGLVNHAVTADTCLARFSAYTNAKILDVFAVNHNGAGTHATNGYTIKKATTSIGVITCGSGADSPVGGIEYASLTDTDVTSTDVINIHNVRSESNLQGFVYVIWQERFSG